MSDSPMVPTRWGRSGKSRRVPSELDVDTRSVAITCLEALQIADLGDIRDIRGQFFHESAGAANLHAAEAEGDHPHGDLQGLLAAGHAHVEQAPLLLPPALRR